MSEVTSKIGIIGLAVMGAHLARNFAAKKITTSVYNRTKEVTNKFLSEHGNEYLKGTSKLEEFVNSIELPRKIFILVKAGDPVDQVIQSLIPLLQKDDIIVDLGNSHYKDTERRSQLLNEYMIQFVGCGISGGEKGALEGPSIMPGGPEKAWKELKPLLEKIAAKDFHGGPCVSHIGTGGAGHYIKMVHNGIEYGVMQTIAEGYETLKTIYNMPAPQIGEIFKTFNGGKMNTYLMELASVVLKKEDPNNKGQYLVDMIMDKAAQKGTGTWTAIESLERAVAAPTITEAVYSRIMSGNKDKRKILSSLFVQKKDRIKTENQDLFVHYLEDAMYAALMCIIAQGFDLIQKASNENNWNTDPAEVCRIWQGGCIIRAKKLENLELCFREHGKKDSHVFEMPRSEASLKGNIESLRRVLIIAIENGIPVPALSSALSYYDGIIQERGNANLIQALRDAFGAHTYERVDKEGVFHTEWVE